MLRLKCASQRYDWGKVGMNSIVYQLQVASENPDIFHVDLPYAELWMGTHPSGPSCLWDNPHVTLATHIQENPASLGKLSLIYFGRRLPFLFKVLSVAKALSIQAHPDKKMAVRLHAEQPDLYKDGSHKPEMAIALTDFEALLGFRPLNQILAFIQAFPELAELTTLELPSPEEKRDVQPPSIKQLYSNLMRSSSEKVESTIKSLLNRFTTGLKSVCDPPLSIPGVDPQEEDVQALVDLFLRLTQAFPGDVGCLSIFFLNYIRLKSGEAIFLKANTPHAYLSGDCVECMANSDNVVRAGLTPKFKDVERLLEMLDYAPLTDSLRLGATQPIPTPEGISLKSFIPPVSEFAVDVIQFDAESRGFSLPSVPTASILLFLHGQGTITCSGTGEACSQETKFGPGFVYFVPADMIVNLVSKEDRKGSLHAFRAYVNRK
uniref:mannose-6-phosphate isomerase n=1 Tax=Echinococcus granulosus TaxID=6210 RepID=A0A068WL65_ECHGR|nr:mannose 6 phosphate isomerase [Echinococcus granulosus]